MFERRQSAGTTAVPAGKCHDPDIAVGRAFLGVIRDPESVNSNKAAVARCGPSGESPSQECRRGGALDTLAFHLVASIVVFGAERSNQGIERAIASKET